MTDKTMTDRAGLAALMGSRICHDLISPIGAIGNGVELMLMDGNTRGPEMALISESVENANARICFFRIAFGSCSEGQRTGRSEVVSALTAITRAGRLSIDWDGPPDLARSDVRLAFLMIMCLETAMAWGGSVTVQTDGKTWSLRGAAARLRHDPALWKVLSDPRASYEFTAALVHFALLREEMIRLDRRLELDIGAEHIGLRF